MTDEEWLSLLGQSIRQVRKESGLSAQSAASALGVNHTTVYRFESGLHDFPVTRLYKLSKLFHVPASRLLPIGQESDDTSVMALHVRLEHLVKTLTEDEQQALYVLLQSLLKARGKRGDL